MGDNIEMYEGGDMDMTQDAPLDEGRRRKWPNGRVDYAFERSFPAADRQTVRNALALITQAAKCITFREHTSNPPRAHVEVFRGTG